MNWLTHPATVHVPIALGLFLPLMFAVTWWATSREILPFRIWYFVAAFSGLHLGGAVVAYVTGLYAQVLSTADPAEISSHLLWAQALSVHALLVFALIAFLALRQPRHRWFMPLALLFVMAQWPLAFWVGHIGGKMVFG